MTEPKEVSTAVRLVEAWKMMALAAEDITLHWHLNTGKIESEPLETYSFWSSQGFSKLYFIYLSLEKDNTCAKEAPTVFHGKKPKFSLMMIYLWKWMITNNRALVKRMSITENMKNFDSCRKILQAWPLKQLMNIQWPLENCLDGSCLQSK